MSSKGLRAQSNLAVKSHHEEKWGTWDPPNFSPWLFKDLILGHPNHPNHPKFLWGLSRPSLLLFRESHQHQWHLHDLEMEQTNKKCRGAPLLPHTTVGRLPVWMQTKQNNSCWSCFSLVFLVVHDHASSCLAEKRHVLIDLGGLLFAVERLKQLISRQEILMDLQGN